MTSIPTIPKTYRAVSCPGLNRGFEFVTVPVRDPKPTELFLKVLASGICNSDHFLLDGMWPGISYPRIPGHEVIARIVSFGSVVDPRGQYKVGDVVGVGWSGGYCSICRFCRKGDFAACVEQPVTGFSHDGGHGEFMYAPQNAIVTLPEDSFKNSSYAELAPLLCAGVTVYDAVRTSPHKPGDICVVQGIGGLGHLAIQYAVKIGLKVFAVSSGSAKKALAKSLGAYEYVDANQTDVVQHIQSHGGAKVIICTAPSSKQISSIIPAASRYGVITLVSAAADGNVEVFNPFMNMRRVTLRGWACGAAHDAEDCVRFSTMANIKAMVREFKLEEFNDAFEDMVAGKPQFRNVLVFPE
ncbi:hypothetical protein EWM64_g4875 [Hericium alpestre]|uniref:Enoyl reductase (ER) domain-containing protein n=1 Tax=Hericium alpestre TaxID=135208 RepID=A0A4Y9ZY60_9AGAM|nr:hypothetical protein EWM64_g4875 [Hericium alpestre]